MKFPDYFDQAAVLALYDPLAEVLGAAEDGVLEYRYADAVSLAGHSCPTVAGSWLMARRALSRLYPDSMPLRGGLRVELREAQAAGTTGVVGNVLGLVTGAAGEGGFDGLAGGRFVRRYLLVFDVPMQGEVRVTRLDSGASVEMVYSPRIVPPAPEMPPLMKKLLSGEASAEEAAEFKRLWRERVRRILIEHADDPELLQVL